MDLTKSQPLKLRGEKEGIFQLELPKTPLQLSPFVLFIRAVGSDYEVIARGKVETVQNQDILVSIDRTSILKYPRAGDLAIPLGTPKDWPKGEGLLEDQIPIQAEEIGPEPDPGYIQFSYGLLSGSLASSSSDGLTNEYKDATKYQTTLIHFAWYFDFFWRLGLEYEKSDGSLPTSTYYHQSGQSSDQWTTMSINYRFRRTWMSDRLRPVARALATTNRFSTLNADEALISSSMSAYGLGLRLSYEPSGMLWQPKVGSGMIWRQLLVDLNYYPFAEVADDEHVRRGTASAGSQFYEVKVATNGMFYWSWLPVFHRFTLEAGYAMRSASYKFQGKTQSEAGGGYTVPENMSARENYQWFYVSLGLCLDDYIGQIFKPR